MAVYAIGEGNNFYETMTKEQILAAIVQAVESHTISDVDTGFVTTLKEGNKNTPLALWVGTEAEYNAIQDKDDNTLYIKTDDSTLEAIEAQLAEYNAQLSTFLDMVKYIPDENGEVEIFPANSQIYFDGCLTSGRKAILFTIPLPKSIEMLGDDIILVALKANIRHVAGGYVASGSYYVDGGTDFIYSPSQTTYETVIANKTSHLLTLSITREDDGEIETNATGNTPVSVEINEFIISQGA